MAETTQAKGTFTLLYFAAASTLTQRSSETFEAPMTVTILFETLEERYTGMHDKVLSSSALTINLNYIDLDTKGRDYDQCRGRSCCDPACQLWLVVER